MPEGVDVFISYNSGDRPRVERIAEKLADIGLRVWFDARLKRSTTYDEEIGTQLRAARTVLVCWSPNSVSSAWVRAEAAYALAENKLVAARLGVRPRSSTSCRLTRCASVDVEVRAGSQRP